jgi:hypothetical protein
LEAHPDQVKIVAMDDPDDLRLELAGRLWGFGGEGEGSHRDLEERLHS